MRIIYLANNRVGWQILSWLKEQGEEIVGLVVHPPQKGKYRDELLNEVTIGNPTCVFEAPDIHHPETIKAIHALQPDIALSVFFGYILKPEFLNLIPEGCINIHPAYLPYNRGSYPNVWSIIEGTPAGATIHYIDTGIDTGDIIAQEQIPIEPVDTGETLYRKQEEASITLFQKTWPLIRTKQAPCIPQPHQEGTFHRKKDVVQIDHIDLDRSYAARDLINIIRARTFFPYKGAYIEEGGRRVYLQLQLAYEEDYE